MDENAVRRAIRHDAQQRHGQQRIDAHRHRKRREIPRARLSSSPGFSYLYGYAQADIKMPAGNAQGLWPAFWQLPMPASGTNDDEGEIDITEVIDGQNIDNVHLHHSGFTTYGKTYTPAVNISQSYNEYGINWEPGSLTFYFNDTAVGTVTGSIVPDLAEYLILDLAVSAAG